MIFNEPLAEKYLRKGSKVYLEGALQTRKWTDQGGQERYSTEIVLNRFRGELTMLDGAQGARGAGGPPMEGGYDEGCGRGFDDEPTARGAAAPARAGTPVNDLDDDIPFYLNGTRRTPLAGTLPPVFLAPRDLGKGLTAIDSVQSS